MEAALAALAATDVAQALRASRWGYAAVNGLNATTVASRDAWIGIVASGITYLEVREAFARLGLASDDALADAGLAMLRAGGDFADGVIAFEGDLLGGTEFVSFDQQAVKLLKTQKRKARLLVA